MAREYPSLAVANYGLALLTLIYISNQWSRYILNYLYAVPYDDDKENKAERISIAYACDLTTSEYGILTGYGFSATFVVTGLFMGRAADKHNRRNIVTIGCYIWNLALAAMGMSSNFYELLIFRLVLGFGEAFSNPASYSMIADLFPPEKRPQANGIFASGVYVGGGLASISESLAEEMGWRYTCYLTAAVGGLLCTLLLCTMSEPPRQNLDEMDKIEEEDEAVQGSQEATEVEEQAEKPSQQQSTLSVIKWLLTDPHTLVLFIAASVRFMGGYAIAGYLPYFYDYAFSSYSTQYSYINAYVVAFGGFCSSWGGGKITTLWKESANHEDPSRRWPGAEKANYYVPMIGALLGIPFICICCLASDFYVSLCVGLFLEYLVAECWFGPYMSALQEGVPPTMRGLAVATMMFMATFFGSLMSYLIGEIYDALVDDGYSHKVVRYLVLYSVVGTYAVSALLFYQASRITPATAKASGSTSETTSLLHQQGSSPATAGNGSEPA
uniref:Major facilitator superfamily (MFS) profile domain-containing protein n=1 Tax=Rhizochromulina marina TaxID=1034831 RepID=A0A7S2WU90_9STRA|mmetsp:Transcript_5979/g.17485  ORF Transcript_5979/g.17485 Transcript_5979/m.17485 type:complete len:499 (+) Transcript_5979:40-1536(+)